MTLREEEPRNALQARVNMRYCIAAALRYGELTFRQFDDSLADDPALRDLMRTIALEVADDLPDNGEFPAELRGETRDGKGGVERREGHPGGYNSPVGNTDTMAQVRASPRRPRKKS